MVHFKGLTRVRRNGREVEGSVYLARLTVPADVRIIAAALPENDHRRASFISPTGKPKADLLESTGHVDPVNAARVAEPILARWRAQISALRQTGNPEKVADAHSRIERWRRREVKLAQSFGITIALASAPATARSSREPGDRLHMAGIESPQAPGIEVGATQWASDYFKARPHASRDTATPFETFQLVERLGAAESNPDGWRDVEGFEARFVQEIGESEPKIRTAARPGFARAWREVIEAQETERRHAAALLRVVADANSQAPMIAPTAVFIPRAGDRTVGQLLDAYWSAKASKDVVAPARAVREFFGAKTPVRSIMRGDARRFADFVPRIPINVAQRYPGQTLVQAVEAADIAGSPPKRLSEATVARYLTFVSMFWNWAADERDGWVDTNPFRGLSDKGDDTAEVVRRPFRDPELIAFFDHQRMHKAQGLAKFWAPALMLSGARLAEICQLRTDDVRDFNGTPYLNIKLTDATGRIDPLKRLKNSESIRLAPIHPLVIKAGFLDVVKRRRQEGAERLFEDSKPYTNKKTGDVQWGHYLSKALNTSIGKAVTKDPDLVVHGLRHTFRTRAEQADVDGAIIDAIAGWTQKTVGRKYGERDVPLLSRNLARLDFGALRL